MKSLSLFVLILFILILIVSHCVSACEDGRWLKRTRFTEVKPFRKQIKKRCYLFMKCTKYVIEYRTVTSFQEHYACCKGFRKVTFSNPVKCNPICIANCQPRGKCIQPNVCQCDWGLQRSTCREEDAPTTPTTTITTTAPTTTPTTTITTTTPTTTPTTPSTTTDAPTTMPTSTTTAAPTTTSTPSTTNTAPPSTMTSTPSTTSTPLTSILSTTPTPISIGNTVNYSDTVQQFSYLSFHPAEVDLRYLNRFPSGNEHQDDEADIEHKDFTESTSISTEYPTNETQFLTKPSETREVVRFHHQPILKPLAIPTITALVDEYINPSQDYVGDDTLYIIGTTNSTEKVDEYDIASNAFMNYTTERGGNQVGTEKFENGTQNRTRISETKIQPKAVLNNSLSFIYLPVSLIIVVAATAGGIYVMSRFMIAKKKFQVQTTMNNNQDIQHNQVERVEIDSGNVRVIYYGNLKDESFDAEGGSLQEVSLSDEESE